METLEPAALSDGRLDRPGTVAVLFTASWCPFCRRFEPRFASLEGRVGGALAVADLTDEENPLWETYRIEVVPVVVGFVDGRPAWRFDSPLGVGLGEKDLDEVRAKLGAAPGPGAHSSPDSRRK
jgi:thioredoxin 1